MSVALLQFCDGRTEYHDPALASAEWALPQFDQIVRVDDPQHTLGFAGAIQCAWEQVETDWCFHLEADFIFHQPVPLARMIGVLQCQPHLVQLVLKRQPWNPLERAAGGIVEQDPDAYTDRHDGDDRWAEHRRFFSTNPSVYSSRLCRVGWPQEEFSEGKFTHKLLADPHLRFAFWGAKHDPPLVEHIGHIRTGVGY